MRSSLRVLFAAILLLALTSCRHDAAIDVVVEFRHLRPADKALDVREFDGNNNLGDAIAKDVSDLGLKFVARGGSGGIDISSESGGPKVHVLLLAPEPVLSDVELLIPRSGDVVYLLRNQQWEAHPQDVTKPAPQKIKITTDPAKKGAFALKVTGMKEQPDGFKYVPSFDEDVQMPGVVSQAK